MLQVCDMRLRCHEAHFFLSFLKKKKRKKKLSVGPSVQPQHSHRSHISSHILACHTEETLGVGGIPAAGLCVCVCVCSFRELSEVREIEKSGSTQNSREKLGERRRDRAEREGKS